MDKHKHDVKIDRDIPTITWMVMKKVYGRGSDQLNAEKSELTLLEQNLER